MYHVTARGNRGEPIFADDADRQRFLGSLGHVVGKFEWTCHAYCLMTTHYHLMITIQLANIGREMHLINGGYAQAFNRQHGVSGHVFEDRYYSVVVERDSHLLELIRYIALNPVRAGLCSAPEQWSWSSYRYALGLPPKPDFLSIEFLLECFATDRALAPRHLREFVSAGLRRAEASSACTPPTSCRRPRTTCPRLIGV
jgi:REP-associated tyrosine transposase